MVIQRWQSVLLLVAAVMMSLFTFITIGSIEKDGVVYSFDTLGLHTSQGTACSTWAFFVLSLLSALLPLINIFKLNEEINLQEEAAPVFTANEKGQFSFLEF